MFCYTCGEKNQEHAIFCKKCGIRIVAEDSVLLTTPVHQNTSFFGTTLRIFSNIASYTMEIIISALISFAVLFGIFWAWAKYHS